MEIRKIKNYLHISINPLRLMRWGRGFKRMLYVSLPTQVRPMRTDWLVPVLSKIAKEDEIGFCVLFRVSCSEFRVPCLLAYWISFPVLYLGSLFFLSLLFQSTFSSFLFQKFQVFAIFCLKILALDSFYLCSFSLLSLLSCLKSFKFSPSFI